uniref:C-type lectin domain-containing protein n=1 Tax=Chelonoidis abingdonii TaxID=106734 RepID=A0A8C0J105_CHEAB
MLSLQSLHIFAAVVFFLVTCHAEEKCAGTPGIPGTPGANGLPGRDGRDGMKGDPGPPVLTLEGKITEVRGKILATNGKEANFETTLKACEHASGSIATPKDQEENDAILAIVKQFNRYAYLGIRESDVPGEFQYLDGKPLNYTNWHAHEPNGKGGENCVEMYTDGGWNDKKCNQYRLTICEF